MLETLASLLRETCIDSEATVAVILPDGVCGLVSLLGVMRVCACAPMNPALTATELEGDLLELNAVAIITSAEFETPRVVAEKLGLVIIEVSLPASACVWRVRQPWPRKPDRPAKRENGGATLLLHTSGTTGRRKVVPLSSENLHAMLENTANALQLAQNDRLLMLARLFHVQGILSPLAQLLRGGSIIITSGFSPQAFGRWLETLQPTWYTCGPTLHRAILAHLEGDPLPGRTSLRFVRSGGAPLPADLRARLEAALHVPVLNVYGLSETGAVAGTTPELCDSDSPCLHNNSVGKSMGPEIAVMSSDGIFLPVGEEGEIVVSGPSVMAGYLNDPAANREAFFGQWFRTGDLGRLDRDGWLHVTGRLKEMINRGGQKISPGEVDAVFNEHEAVLEVATFGVPHATLGEDVACAVVMRKGFVAGERELREFAAKKLAAFKVPRKIYQVDGIPCGATGKPQRLVLRERFSPVRVSEDHSLSNGAFELEPLTPFDYLNQPQASFQSKPTDLDQSLQFLWWKHLQTQSADLREDFFSSGGDSLSAVAMLTEVEALFGLKTALPHATFFQEPTLATTINMVTEALAGRKTDASSSSIEVVSIRKGNGQLPLFMIPSNGEEGSCFRRLSRILGAEWPLSLVRPGNCWHEHTVSSIEEAGAASAAAIRGVNPTGPYLVGGYCYGGVVAYETAYQLGRLGDDVLLMLFDTPTPGSPHMITDWRTYLRAVAGALGASWRTRKPKPILRLSRRLLRRAAWFALRRAHPKKSGLWSFAPLRWICREVQAGYFSFYRPGSTTAPILHFIAQHEHDFLMAKSRFGWQELALSGMTVQWMTGGHNSLFDEANLHRIAEAITSWSATHSVQRIAESSRGD